MKIQQTARIDGHTVGLIFMAFGPKAGASVSRSIFSLQRLGVSYPVTVVGDRRVMGTDFREWIGESPFDTSQRTNFKFRAGRIKPLLYQCSPYDWTMYLDADAVFMKPVEDGFRYLADHDMVVTEETLTLAELYNKKLAGWEINIQERDTTIVEIGGDDTQKFINSGVFFFRKSEAVEKAFIDWRAEWLRFQEWDEQLALTRALHNNPEVKVKRLSVAWNAPHMHEKDLIIYHPYGRAGVRANPI
jgi:hypothetical protein